MSLFFHLGCNWDVKADRVSQHQVKWAWFSFSILHKRTASSFSVISRRIMEDKSDTTSPEAVWTHWADSVCVCVCFSLVVSGSLDRVCRYTATDMQPCAAVEDAHMIKIPEQRYNIPLHRHFHRHGNSRNLWRDTTRNCLRMIRLSLRSSYYRWMDLHGHWEIPNCDCPSHYTGGRDEEVWGPALFIRV